MRSREELENQMEGSFNSYASKLLLEATLDVRDLLLEKTKPKGKSREEWERKF